MPAAGSFRPAWARRPALKQLKFLADINKGKTPGEE
jgi:hypothetical protein